MANQSTPYDERFLWTSGSICCVYSRSRKRWYKGTISDICIDIDSKQEWLTVQYNHKRTRKKMQRLCADIKPIPNIVDHRVWVIGNNKYVEFGANIDSDCSTLTLCEWSKDLNNVIGINRGLGFNIYTVGTHYDELLVFGYIKSYIMSDIESIAIPNHIRVHILSYFGANYNRYWSLGLNDFGQCCIGHCNRLPFSHPQLISYPMPNINKICIGSSSRNVLWIKNDGTLYIAGRNLHKHIASMEITLPTLCYMDEWSQRSLKIIDAAASHFHCMVICNDGSVWSLGRGAYGELGHGRHPKLLSEFFAKIKTLRQHTMVNVSAGNYFSLFLCDDGNVWSCGINTSAQCGLGYCDEERNRFPTKIDYFFRIKIKIKQIECGESHSIALSRNGSVYCWGNNNYGQCAINISIERMVTIPTIIQYLSSIIVSDIRCGSNHTAVITNNKEYYIWGCNENNECITTSSNSIAKPHQINQYIYNTTNCKRIVDISLGQSNTIIIVEKT